MFVVMGYIMKAWVMLWMSIIATIPQLFMLALTLCVLGTLLTYLPKKK